MKTAEASGGRQATARGTSRVVFAEKPFALAERVRERLRATREEMAPYLGVPVRTYHRRARTGTLTGAESVKVERLDTLLDLGEQVLGSEEEARPWLTSPILSLGSECLADLLDAIKG